MTKRQIRTQLEQLRIQRLEADLISETEEWHTFMLKARAGNEWKQVEIKCKPTLVQDEEVVSDADRQLHQRIGAEIKAVLETKGRSSEGVETFEAFYEMIRDDQEFVDVTSELTKLSVFAVKSQIEPPEFIIETAYPN